MQKVEEEKPFEIRPGRPKIQSEKYGHFPKPLRVVMRKADRIRRNDRKAARKAAGITAPIIPGPQCVIRVFTVSANRGRGSWRAAGQYLAVNKPGQVEPWEVFDAAGSVTDSRELLGQWYEAGDYGLYTMVISPNDRRVDLKEFTRDLMAGLNDELSGSEFRAAGTGVPYGAKLEWRAAAHYDTEHHHVHLALRGRSGGERFSLPMSMEKGGGLRRIAAVAIEKQMERQKKLQVEKQGREMPQRQRAMA